MDTWFTNEPMIKSVLMEGLDVIGMVKQLAQRYNYKGRSCTLPELKKYVCFDGAKISLAPCAPPQKAEFR